jgi:hypothetical protein
MPIFTLQRTSTADMDTVFDVLTDHRGYADISGPRKCVLRREGDPAPNGLGAIREIHVLGPPIVEEVHLYERPGRFGYTVLSGLPVKRQTGEVTLSHSGGGTHVSYRLEIEPKFGPAGAAFAYVTRSVVWTLLRDIVKAADKRAAAKV